MNEPKEIRVLATLIINLMIYFPILIWESQIGIILFGLNI